MKNLVAPGEEGYNILSKRHLFRVILLRTTVPEENASDSFILESEDGSYHLECPIEDAIADGPNLIFEFFVRDREKKYHCYFKNQAQNPSEKMKLKRLGMPMGKLQGSQERGS